MRIYKHDPRIIRAKFDSKCLKCGKAIKKGEHAYYWPKHKEVFCECGKADFDNFVLSANDEENYNSRQM